MADVIETMYCEIVFKLDGGDLDFLCVCVCVCGMTADHGILLLYLSVFQ